MGIHAYNGRLTTRNNTLNTFTTADADYCDLVTGSNQGTIVDEITITSTENVTVAGTLRFFIHDAGETPTSALHTQISVPVVQGNPQGGVPTYTAVIRPLDIKLHNNQSLRAAFATSSTTTIGFHLTASVTHL